MATGDFFDFVCLLVQGGGVGAVNFHNHAGGDSGVEFQFAVAGHGLEADFIHQFGRSGDNARLQHVVNGIAGVVQFGEHQLQRVAHLGHGNETQQDFGDHAERAFRTDEQLGQVIASDIFESLAAGLDDVAVGQHDFQSHDIVVGNAVFDGAHAASVLGDVAAERRIFPAGRIGRIKQTLGGAVVVEIDGAHARFRPDHHVFLVQFEDFIQSGQREGDAAREWDAAAGSAAGGSPRSHGDAVGVGDFHDGGDFSGGCRPNHHFRLILVGDGDE